MFKLVKFVSKKLFKYFGAFYFFGVFLNVFDKIQKKNKKKKSK